MSSFGSPISVPRRKHFNSQLPGLWEYLRDFHLPEMHKGQRLKVNPDNKFGDNDRKIIDVWIDTTQVEKKRGGGDK